ncbi:MAG: D-glycero-beta-D-manno-heptose 1-phosphate adenylyltransferase [Bacteroidales bacterium]|nr:D-glycero-beta-D-manno-heptose 1-phosphate adenylyltransferase [Bacteroidales bacterium]
MSSLSKIQNKIVDDRSTLGPLLLSWAQQNKKIVFTNGCFDLLHRGHIEYLANAADCGDILVLGLNSDKSVKKLKGNNRPIKDEYSRALILAGLSFITNIIIFDNDTPLDLIEFIQPNVLVKGGDYKAEDIVGYEIVKSSGGEVVIVDFVKGQSSTLLINKMEK